MYHYYLFHKPFGCVTARRDDRYPTVMDWFAGLNNPDLSPVGRLDRETEGLLLITDDGMFNRQMTRPEFHKEKTYTFTLLGDLTEEKRLALEAGVLLNGEDTPTAPARITVTGKSTLGAVLPTLHPEIREKSAHNPQDRPVTFGTITITEGRNRQIRRMMKTQRLLVLQLKRIKMGEITLPSDLKPGEWMEISPKTCHPERSEGSPPQAGDSSAHSASE
ncbi:MAG: pseudouridine synthase [Clostridia bacterium]|nr:pseudouridine synthase [Clostridia bacterium]